MSRHYVAQEDLIKAQKTLRGSAPAVPEAKNEVADHVSKKAGDASHLVALSNYWVALDAHYSSEEWPLTSCAGRHFRPEYFGSRSEYLVCDEVPKPSKPVSDLEVVAEGATLAGKHSSGTFRRVQADYGDSSDLELEWQLVVEHQLRGKPNFDEYGDSLVQQQVTDSENSSEECIQPEAEISEEVRHRDVRSHEGCGQLAHCPTPPSRTDVPPKVQARRCVQHSTTAPPSDSSNSLVVTLKDGLQASPQLQSSNVSWRTAGRGELAALVAQKAGGQLENCDLPIPRSTSRIKQPLEACKLGHRINAVTDLNPSVDGKLLASLLQGHEPSRLDYVGLPTAPLVPSNTDPSPGVLPGATQPLPIPPSSSDISRSMIW